MPPKQPYQSNPGSQPPAGPAGLPYTYGGAPQQAPQFQQQPGGPYEVVPTPQPVQNDGHSGHNPYEFIVNPNAAPTQSNLNLGPINNPFFVRIALLGGGVIAIIIVAAILISALAPKGSTPGMISITERQQEIIRVSTAALQQATAQDTLNFVANVQTTVSSNQGELLTYLTAHGVKKPSSKTLALDQSTATDTQLAEAATANNYDSAVTQNLTSQLQTYQRLLKTSFGQTKNTQTQKMLQSDYKGTSLLLNQASVVFGELQQ